MNFGFGRGVVGPCSKQKIAFGKITLSTPAAATDSTNTSTESVVVGSDASVLNVQDELKREESGGGGFGSFSFAYKPPEKSKEVELSPEEAAMQQMMGFSGFGTSKKVVEKSAKNFDVKEMVEAIKKAKKLQKDQDDEGTDEVILVDEQSIKLAEEEARKKKLKEKAAEKEKQTEDKEEEESNSDDELIGPMPPPPSVNVSSNPVGSTDKTKYSKKSDEDSSDDSDSASDEKDSDNDDDGDGDSDTEAEKKFPLEHQLNMEHGDRPVTALSVDPTATRFATGSLDYEVKFWDFTGLRNKHAFRSTKPCENHPIKHVSFSSNGEALLVISGSAQAKVLNRDGSELLECAKGDQYIVDMARTKGHVAGLTGGMFNPKNKSVFMTSSDDSTVRLWEVENPRTHKTLVKYKNAGGLKNRVTACCFSRDGNCFMGAGTEGAICMWDSRKPLVLPTATIKNAHDKNTDIFHVLYSNSGLQVASRGEDAVVNIFDIRNWRKPLFKSEAHRHPAKFFTTDLSFSPDDRHLLIPTLPKGTTGRTKDELITHSSLEFLSTKTLTYVKEHIFPNQIVIRTAWHHRINQILVSFASGNFGILYDSNKSQRGALLAHGKGPKKQKAMGVVEDMYGKVVITPNSLPLYKTERSKNPKREEAKMRADPVKSRRPDLPITAGSGGRVAASGSTLSSYVIRNLGLSKSVKDDMDPREAILRYAKDAEENPIWVTPAYKKTQPKTIFENVTEEEAPDPKKPRLM